MPFGVTYDPPQTVSPWGNASETKQESTSTMHSSSSGGGESGWNSAQWRLANPWTKLGKRSIGQIRQTYNNAQPALWDTVQRVLNWTNSPPQEYLAGREALLNSFTPTATEDFYQHSVRDPALREWEQVTRPGLREAYAGNYYHSDRMRREAELARDLALNLANKRADLEFQSQEAAKGRSLQGAPIALNYAQFIPQTQANFLEGYTQNINPLLAAMTQYMSTKLHERNWNQASSTSRSHSASHGVTGVNKPPEGPAPATVQPKAWHPYVDYDTTNGRDTSIPNAPLPPGVDNPFQRDNPWIGLGR